MKYRILIDGKEYYPQKKGLFFWKFYRTLIKPPYGNPFVKKEYATTIDDALEILEKNGVNVQNSPILIKRGCSDDWYCNHTVTFGCYCIVGIILLFFILFKKLGMM